VKKPVSSLGRPFFARVLISFRTNLLEDAFRHLAGHLLGLLFQGLLTHLLSLHFSRGGIRDSFLLTSLKI
jgi:hypothetical protein